jgi:HK97 family phage prohead protease
MSKRNFETRYLAAEEVKAETAEGATKPQIVGYAAVFDVDSEDLGGFKERIRPGTFTRALRDGADVRALINHDPTMILGRNKAGTLRLKPNAKGLLSEIDPPDTSYARDLMEAIKRGDISGMSFVMAVRSDEWHMEDGFAVREVLDADILDVSIVTYPAYPDTDVAVRSLELFKAKVGELSWRVPLARRRQEIAERA